MSVSYRASLERAPYGWYRVRSSFVKFVLLDHVERQPVSAYLTCPQCLVQPLRESILVWQRLAATACFSSLLFRPGRLDTRETRRSRTLLARLAFLDVQLHVHLETEKKKTQVVWVRGGLKMHTPTPTVSSLQYDHHHDGSRMRPSPGSARRSPRVRTRVPRLSRDGTRPSESVTGRPRCWWPSSARIERFPTADYLASWAGMGPGNHQRAGP